MTEEAVGKPERASPLDEVARAQIAARLRTALALAERGGPEAAAALDELLEDLADRAAALEVAQALEKNIDGESGRLSSLRCAVLGGEPGAPPTEFLLIPFGEVKVERACAGSDFVFTRRHAESAVRWFERIGRKLAIDYEHQSFDRFNTRADGLRPAAGWIGGLEIRSDGLWAVDVSWTERARELLRAGEYRYFSPVIFWTDEDQSDVAALGPVALTNDPAMHGVRALAARRGLPDAGAGGDDADPPSARFVPREELEAAQAEIALLRNELRRQEADAFVERGLRLGKIVDATSMDWREAYLRDPEEAEAQLARAAVVLPPGRVVGLDRRGAVRPLSSAERDFRRHADVLRRWGIEPEDLTAYEQAVAAGRVVQPGGTV